MSEANMEQQTDKRVLIIRAAHSKERPYFLYRTATAQDDKLTLEGLGLLTYLLSKPVDWEVRIADLTKRAGSQYKAYKILRGLRKAGYMTLSKESGGRYGKWVYQVFEDSQLVENQLVENQHTYKVKNKNKRKKKDSLLPEGNGEKPKKERKPNPVFDAVVKYVFEIDPEMTKEYDQTAGLIGAIAAWLSGKSDGIMQGRKKLTVGRISRPAEPEHIQRFAEDYKKKNPTAYLPTGFEAFVRNWRKWATSARSASEPVPASPAHAPFKKSEDKANE